MPSTLYRTSDFYLASWLLLNGLHLQKVDHLNRQRSTFMFLDQPERLELVNRFLDCSAIGNIADFVECVRKAKRLLYSSEDYGA